ncbi:hypothetical protein KSP39_PZI004010 [Platanthera zijinensis]|uniref:CCHC-type domain-containing protein n=1 Tax=Platanthera zijinensis TaxID=2320716 RepID=A0AAP0BWU5_9ASPA
MVVIRSSLRISGEGVAARAGREEVVMESMPTRGGRKGQAEGLYTLAKYKKPLFVHAEVVTQSESDDAISIVSDPRSYTTYLNTRPASCPPSFSFFSCPTPFAAVLSESLVLFSLVSRASLRLLPDFDALADIYDFFPLLLESLFHQKHCKFFLLSHSYDVSMAAPLLNQALCYSHFQTLGVCYQHDRSVYSFFVELLNLCRQRDEMAPLPCATCTQCIATSQDCEFQCMHEFLMRLHLEFESFRAQLLPWDPLPSLNDTLSLVIAEETRLLSLDSVTPPGVMSHVVLAAPQLPSQSSLVSAPLLPSPGYSALVRLVSRPPPTPFATQSGTPCRTHVRCYHCLCLGHVKSECRKLQRAQQSGQQRAPSAPSAHFFALVQSLSVSDLAQQLSQGSLPRYSASVLPPDAFDASASQPTAFALAATHITFPQLACPGAHTQNDTSERKDRHIIETSRIILLSSHLAFVKHHLQQQFQMTNLGQLSYFLGLEVTSSGSDFSALSATASRGLFFSSCSSLQLRAYSDATWASDHVNRRFVTGFCLFLGSSLIARNSKKQTGVSCSSTKDNLWSMDTIVEDIFQLPYLLEDLDVSSPDPTPLLRDNTVAIQITLNPVKHYLSKHIGVDAFFLREYYGRGTLALYFVSSEHQFADLMTKPRTRNQYTHLLSKLSVYDPP